MMPDDFQMFIPVRWTVETSSQKRKLTTGCRFRRTPAAIGKILKFGEVFTVPTDGGPIQTNGGLGTFKHPGMFYFRICQTR